jgi:hypothetical protein
MSKTTAMKKQSSQPAFVGLRIARIEYMDAEEARELAWDSQPCMLVLEDDTRLYVSSDEEGNAPGTLVAEGNGISHSFYPRTKWHSEENLKLALLHIVGHQIANGRFMSGGRMGSMGWSKHAFVLKLDNGIELIPFSDPEGNEAGSWFGYDRPSPLAGVSPFAIYARR